MTRDPAQNRIKTAFERGAIATLLQLVKNIPKETCRIHLTEDSWRLSHRDTARAKANVI